MTAFWISAGLLTLLALTIVCWPLLRRRQGSAASRRAINAAIYRDQLAELERDMANGTLSPADHATAREELERRILEDLGEEAEPMTTPPGRLPRTALGLTVSLPLAAVALYFVLGNPQALDPASHQVATQSAAEVEQMVANLAERLRSNPDNPEGWAMLARSYKVMGRLDAAAQAFDKAGSFVESDPDLMLDVAELSAEMNEGRVEGRGAELLRKVLKEHPDSPQALVLAGTDAYFRKQYPQALVHWEKVLAQLPPDSEEGQALAAGVAKVRSLMSPQATTTTPAAPLGSNDKVTPGAASTLSGRVSLAAALQDKAHPEDTVFIFARAVEGSRMPLAVVRARVADLPRDFVLDDSMAMTPDTKLSSVPAVMIEARVSRSGDAKAQPGDLTGEIGPIRPGSSGVAIQIERILP